MELWVSSIDGQNQWRVKEDIALPTAAEWLNDELIGVYRYEPSAIVNPFTKEWQPLPDAESISVESYLAHLSPDGKQVLHLGENNNEYGWYVSDYQPGVIKRVFPWIDDLTSFDPIEFVMYTNAFWLSTGIAVITYKPYGLDIANNLSVSQASEKNTLVYKVALPGENMRTNIMGWSDDASLLALTRYDYEKGQNGPNPFYVLDPHQNTLYDFCIDRQLIYEKAIFSADSRFVAWTLRSSPDSDATREIIVLDLTTGRYTELKDMELRGWGEIDAVAPTPKK